jgi:hypothetical protein
LRKTDIYFQMTNKMQKEKGKWASLCRGKTTTEAKAKARARTKNTKPPKRCFVYACPGLASRLARIERKTLATNGNKQWACPGRGTTTPEAKVKQRTAELEIANDKLQMLSTTDALTGLSNRRHFDAQWHAEWQRALRAGNPIAMIMLDVDHFKAFNDSLGHPAGDVCLQRVGGILGAVIGPNLANWTRNSFDTPFLGAYLTLTIAGFLGLAVMHFIQFPDETEVKKDLPPGRPLSEILRQPVFVVAVIGSALGYGVMNLLMAATPLAMQMCGMPFSDTALVLEWHVIGMFAPGFFTGSLIKKYGTTNMMGLGVVLNIVCIGIALMGVDVYHFLWASFILGVGWNFLFTAATTLALTAYRPEEKDKAQGAINFFVFTTMAITSFGSGALVTTNGWSFLNAGSLVPVVITGAALFWLTRAKKKTA